MNIIDWLIIYLVVNLLFSFYEVLFENESGDPAWQVFLLSFLILLFNLPLKIILTLVYILRIFWDWNVKRITYPSQIVSLIRMWWKYVVKKKPIAPGCCEMTLYSMRTWVYNKRKKDGREYNKWILRKILMIGLIARNRYIEAQKIK